MDKKQNFIKPVALSDDGLEKVAGGYNGEVISSGSFASQTGTSLNLLVNWNAVADGFGQKTLYVTVSATSYSLYSAANPNTLELNVNGMSYVATPNAISYGGNTQVTNTLASFQIPNAVSPAMISASWRFNGVISGVPLNTIYASGTAIF